MSDENKQKEPSSKERIGYGVKIPSISFEECVRILKEAAELGGTAGDADVLSKVIGNTSSSSTFLYKVYAIRAFGLLNYQDKKYTFTETGEHIVRPESPDQESRYIVEAFSSHPIINKVWDNYKGKILPQREYLANYFEKSLSIPPQLKLDWADYFIEAGKFAKLLLERESGSYQVLLSPLPSANKESFGKVFETVANQAGMGEQKQSKASEKNFESFFDGLSGGLFYQKKISDNRKAMIYIPEDLSDADIVMIRSIIKSVDAGLDGLKKHADA